MILDSLLLFQDIFLQCRHPDLLLRGWVGWSDLLGLDGSLLGPLVKNLLLLLPIMGLQMLLEIVSSAESTVANAALKGLFPSVDP